jgi:hypothetical protein
MSALWSTVRDLFSLDLRSVAVFRIGLASILLWDLSIRFTDLNAHYTDEGVLPRSALTEIWPLCVHAVGGSAGFETLLFIIAGLFAGSLLVGYRTGLTTFVSWFLLVSLHARNPIILQGGDVLLRLLLFWGIFLPLGERWSADAARRRSARRPPERTVSLAAAAFILQLCFVYWFGAALKSHPIWRSEGTAVYYALSIEQLATPLGKSLLGFPTLLKGLTFGTLALEALGPSLLFVPIFRGPIRCFVVVTFVLFHVAGLGLCLELGPFPYVCAVAWLALLPSWFWERKWLVRAGRWLEQRFAAPRQAASGPRPAILTASVMTNALTGFFIIYVLLWNVRTLDPDRYSKFFPQQANVVANMFRVDQWWNMFAPFPLRDDGWYVIEGELKGGSRVDLFRDGQPLNWRKPELVSATYKNERWRKYLMNLAHSDYMRYRAHYLEYLCREWDNHHRSEEQVRRVNMYFMLKPTLPDNQEAPLPERLLLCELSCAGCDAAVMGISPSP